MKERIEYIDLMKGICITLVVMFHSGIFFHDNVVDPMLRSFRIPLYFFLSGLFFKRYGGFYEFFVKKLNKLILPLFFFAYVPYGFLAPIFIPNLSFERYLYMGIIPYNYSLWFLRSLFVTYILAYLLSKIRDRYLFVLIVFIVFIFSDIALLLQKNVQDVVYMQFLYQLITSIIALPFFCFGAFLNKKGFLNCKFNPIILIICSFIALFLLYLTRQVGVDYRTAKYGQNVFYLYAGAFCGIYLVWALCYTIKHFVFFSYIGRYSLVVLGTHVPLIASFQEIGINSISTFIITMLIMPPIIYVFIRIFPYFTAQKDLLVYSSGKLTMNIQKIKNL